MFRTILVHHQEQLYKLYIAFGICRYMPVPYVRLLCGYSHSPVVTVFTTWSNVIHFYYPTTKCFDVFCTGRRTICDYIHIQHYVIAFHNRDRVCLLRGKNCIPLNIFQFKFRLQMAEIHYYITFKSQMGAFKFTDCTFVSCRILISCATPKCPSHLSLVESYKQQGFSVYKILQPTAAPFGLDPDSILP